MCGFYGSLGRFRPLQEQEYKTIGDSLYHRGPDDSGYVAGQGWSIGFRRLSILDLSPNGHQPMSSHDDRYWIVFNGEIYNYLELRRDLEQQGERFSSGSDTEVLLRLLMREGVDGIERLNGMFAFAFIDTYSREFILCRDRLGVKPLYYFHKERELRFASELKGLLAWPDAKKSLSAEALSEYIALGYIPSELCILEGYSKLSPGAYIKGSIDAPGPVLPTSYWNLELNDEWSRDTLLDHELDELEALLLDATRIRLRSDVPVGVFLSGGIDSGLIAAMVARGLPDSEPLAITVAFSEAHYNEADLAQATAEHAGLRQQVIHQTPGSLDAIDEIAWYFDEPFGDPSALPTYRLCKAAARHATVFLSGDGGDEAFGGYRRYIEAHPYQGIADSLRPFRRLITRTAELLPTYSPLRYRLTKLSLPDSGYAAAFDGLPNDPILARLAGPLLKDIQPRAGTSLWQRWETSRQCHILTRQQYLDYAHYLPDDILVKVDRASMANSLEVRSPFLDYRLVEWAAHLPRSLLIKGGHGKQPLRALAARLLPHRVQTSYKRGFGVPLDDWFKQEAGIRLGQERLLSRHAKDRGWWDCDYLRVLLNRHRQKSGRELGYLFWRLLMLDAWARHYLDGDGTSRTFGVGGSSQHIRRQPYASQ